MKILNKFDNFIEKYRIIRFFLLVFLFFQPFTRFAGVRNTAFVSLLLLFLLKLLNGHIKLDLKDKSIQALVLLVAVILLSALVSQYPIESFNAIRKNLFYQLIVFLVIINEYRGMNELRLLFYTLAISFAVLSMIIILKNDTTVLLNWLKYPQTKDTFRKGYSLHATFYIPLIVGYLYAAKDNWKIKGALLLFLFIELSLVFLNNHKGQLVAILVSVTAITLMARRYRTFFTGVILCLVIGITIYQIKPGAFERYTSLLSMETFSSIQGNGWNRPQWPGVVEVVRHKPILGYGYGWKKLATVVQEGGFLEKWKNKKVFLYYSFNNCGYGCANPHNLALQLLFEIGLIGLLAFMLFWFTILKKALSAFKKDHSESVDFLRYGTIGILIAYILINITNGLWEETAGNLMMTLAAVTIVIYKEALGGQDDIRTKQ